MSSASRLYVLLMSVFLAVHCSGCGGAGDQPALGTVTGQITMDGKPLANANVIFQPQNGPSANGITDSDGKYELTYLHGQKGTVVGSNTVYIKTGSSGADPDAAATAEGGVPASTGKKTGKPETVPAKYNSKTELKAEVVDGANTIDFDLKSQ